MDVPPEPTALRPHRLEPVSLQTLFGARDESAGSASSLPIRGISADSRLVAPGDLYLAVGGARTHGADFVPQAVAAGAVAVLTDPQGRQLLDRTGREPGVPVLVTDRPRAEMAELAARIYHRPAETMGMFGVTGTNGKTTTSYLLAAGLRAAGRHVGLIGTLGYQLDDRVLTGARSTVTTPEAPEVQGLLAAMREQGAEAVAMEVSSHALTLGRADAIVFDAVGFTNFGRDHLDFHGSLEAYFEAKAGLFRRSRARTAAVNVDDPRGPELVRRARADGLTVRTTSLEPDPSADYRVVDLAVGPGHTRVDLHTPSGRLAFELGLPGRFNVHNAVTALAMLDLAGIDPASAAHGFADLAVPGRMQPVSLPAGGPEVYVDFAHTPQAVSSALAALRERAGQATGRSGPGRLICVVGCGGDRDPAKREPMGAAAARGADVVVITDDNPRTEDPAAIRVAALAGARDAIRSGGLRTEVLDGGDRRSALRSALELAGPGDVVAVLGKGHEQGQEIGGVVWPFDDVAVVGELAEELTGARSGRVDVS